jgi:hypothetical protein
VLVDDGIAVVDVQQFSPLFFVSCATPTTTSQCSATTSRGTFLGNLGEQDENGKEKDGGGGTKQSEQAQSGITRFLWVCLGTELQGRDWVGEPIQRIEGIQSQVWSL